MNLYNPRPQQNHNGYGSFDSYESIENQSYQSLNLNQLSFPYKLYHLLQNEINDSIQWHVNGLAFHISNTSKFTNELVNKYFKHRRYSSFQRQLNLYGFRKNIAAGVNGSYFHASFQRGRGDMLKHILRLNAVPNNVISATSSSEDVELSHDHYLMDQENLQPRTAYMVREYPPKQIVHSKQLELQSQQQQGHLQEHDDQEWKFPSSTMEDYWQIMDDRVMTYFNKPSTNDANPTTQVYSPRTAVPLPPPYAMSESTEQGNNIASPHPYIDKENIVLSTDISTINSSTFPNQEPVYFEQAPMNMRNMTIVRLHSKPEAPSFRRPPIAVNSTNAPPKKRVRFDCTGSQDCYTESEGRYQSHLQQQMPQPLPNQDGYLHEYIQQWSRNRYIHPMQPLSQFIQQPAINEIEFSQLDQSSAPINRLNSYCDDNTVMFATVSIDSESSQTNTFKGNFEGFGNSVRPTFPEYNTSVYKDADSMDNANVIDGSEDGLHNVSDKGTPFSMAQYFSVY